MKRHLGSALFAAVLATLPTTAGAWESTTHTGLAEQAAIAANLDQHLRALGLAGGLFEPLTIPPADASALIAALARHSPSYGYVPDVRGRQFALSWLLAGAALADANPSWAANHFFDPITGAGWRRPHHNLLGRVRDRIEGSAPSPSVGIPAPDWIVSPDNPLNLNGFIDQYLKALQSATPGERSRHLAGALVAAGAMLHVLGDLSTPERVRGDAAAQLEPVGGESNDRGSRIARIAAIAWGRLGVPAANPPVTLPTWRAYFSGAADKDQPPGLAVWTAAHFFSPNTLPAAIEVGSTRRDDLAGLLTAALRRPAPTVPRRLSLMAANQPSGATLRDEHDVCLARYRVDHSRLSWSLDDECLLEQAAAILPVAGSYQAGFLRWLFRGDLRLRQERGSNVAVAVYGTPLGKGTLSLLAEDERGVRTLIQTVEVASAADGAVVATLLAPSSALRVVAAFRGVDQAGEPMVAAGLITVAQ